MVSTFVQRYTPLRCTLTLETYIHTYMYVDTIVRTIVPVQKGVAHVINFGYFSTYKDVSGNVL